jgi:hypothetical protein
MEVCTIESHKRLGFTAIPAKLLIRSPLARDCVFELRTERNITSGEWDLLFEYLQVCRRSADRARDKDLTGTEDDNLSSDFVQAIPGILADMEGEISGTETQGG